MKRRLPSVGAVLLAVLVAAVLALCVRSYWWRDCAHLWRGDHLWSVESSAGSLRLSFKNRRVWMASRPGALFIAPTEPGPVDPAKRRWASFVHFSYDSRRVFWLEYAELVVPHWITAAPPIVLWLMVRLWRRGRGARRLRRKCCMACGYDLRATPGLACPECGAPAEAAG